MNFFNEGSPYLNHPLLTNVRTRDEVDHLVSILELEAGNRVLDAGCGFGRHTIELARRRIKAVGIDSSATMIEAARSAAAQVEPSIAGDADFRQGRVQDLHGQERFDAAICLFTSLGQVDHDGNDNTSLLERVSTAVRAGGSLIVEVPNRTWVRSNLRQFDSFGDRDDRTDVTRRFEEGTNRVVEQFDVYTDGQLQQFNLSYVLFDHNDLAAILQESGFGKVAIYPTLDAAVVGTELVESGSSPALVAHARAQ